MQKHVFRSWTLTITVTVISAGVTVAQRTTGSRDAALGKAVFDSSVQARVQEIDVRSA